MKNNIFFILDNEQVLGGPVIPMGLLSDLLRMYEGRAEMILAFHALKHSSLDTYREYCKFLPSVGVVGPIEYDLEISPTVTTCDEACLHLYICNGKRYSSFHREQRLLQMGAAENGNAIKLCMEKSTLVRDEMRSLAYVAAHVMPKYFHYFYQPWMGAVNKGTPRIFSDLIENRSCPDDVILTIMNKEDITIEECAHGRRDILFAEKASSGLLTTENIVSCLLFAMRGLGRREGGERIIRVILQIFNGARCILCFHQIGHDDSEDDALSYIVEEKRASEASSLRERDVDGPIEDEDVPSTKREGSIKCKSCPPPPTTVSSPGDVDMPATFIDLSYELICDITRSVIKMNIPEYDVLCAGIIKVCETLSHEVGKGKRGEDEVWQFAKYLFHPSLERKTCMRNLLRILAVYERNARTFEYSYHDVIYNLLSLKCMEEFVKRIECKDIHHLFSSSEGIVDILLSIPHGREVALEYLEENPVSPNDAFMRRLPSTFLLNSNKEILRYYRRILRLCVHPSRNTTSFAATLAKYVTSMRGLSWDNLGDISIEESSLIIGFESMVHAMDANHFSVPICVGDPTGGAWIRFFESLSEPTTEDGRLRRDEYRSFMRMTISGKGIEIEAS